MEKAILVGMLGNKKSLLSKFLTLNIPDISDIPLWQVDISYLIYEHYTIKNICLFFSWTAVIKTML